MKNLLFKPIKQGGVLGRNLKHAQKVKKRALLLFSAIFALFAITLLTSDLSAVSLKNIAAPQAITLATLPVFMVGGKFKELKGEELQKFMNEATPEELSLYLKSKNEAEIEALKSDFNDRLEALKKENNSEAVKELQSKMDVAIKELEAFGLRLKQISDVRVGKDRSMTPIKEALEANKEKIASLRSKGGKVEFEIAEKASHNPTDITGRNQLGQFESSVSPIAHKKVYMEQLFNKGNASTEYIKYVEQATIVRDAKNVAACATSTHNSKVTFNIRDLQMKKVRDYTNVCIDMLDDYSFVEGEIQSLVKTGVALKKDSDLLLGDGISANINGVASYASTFAANASGADYSGKVEKAQLIDLIVVAGAQIKAFGQQNFFSPNVVVLNPLDATLMGLLKDGDNNYIKAGTVNASVFRDANGILYINGMMILENPNCPENEAYIFDSSKGTFYKRKGVVVEMSYENGTNFEQELVTVKAYERCNLRVRNNDANAFMHIDDIAAGIVAITAT